MTVGAVDPVDSATSIVSFCFSSVLMVSKTTQQISMRLAKVDLHYLDVFDELFGCSWRSEVKSYIYRMAHERRRAVEMFEGGDDVALIQDGSEHRWVLVSELENYPQTTVLKSTLPVMIDILDDVDDPQSLILKSLEDYSDYDEDYLP